MKYATDRPYADPEKAARRILEIANGVEAIQGRLHIEKVNRNGGILSLPRASAVHCVVDVAATANRPSCAIVDERRGRETNCFLNLRQCRLVPRVAAVRGLNDRRACTDDPTAIVVDEDPAEQQTPRRRAQLFPRVSRVVCLVDRAAFAKRPAMPVTIEHGANENRIDIETLDLDPLPVLAAVRRLHEVSARVFFGLELILIDFNNEPAIALVGEEDVAHNVCV